MAGMDQLNLDFTKQLGLTESHCARLESEVTRLAKEIAKHRDYSQRAADHHMRKATLKAVVARFAELRQAMQKHKRTLEPMLRGEYLVNFGKQLSYYGLAAITGSSFGDSRRMGLGGSGKASVSAREMERYTEDDRAKIADLLGWTAVDGHLAAIASPLSNMLALESADQGGRPQYIYRNYVIQQLGLLYPELFGKRPTATTRGKFWNLCSNTLQALGIEAGGLKSAIPRALKAAG